MLEILFCIMIIGWICALIFLGVAYLNYLRDKK